MTFRSRPLAALFVASLSLAAPAFAQSDADRATARSLGQEGQTALDAKDYAKAADLFERAEKLFHAPTLMLGKARAYVGVKRLVEAQETYNRMVREGVPPNAPDAFKKAVEDAKREVAELEPRVPSVVITVAGPPEPTVTVDGKPVPVAALGVKRAIDPGPHEVVASSPGWKEARAKVDVKEGQSPKVELKLEKDPNAAAAPPAKSAAPAPSDGKVAPPPPTEPAAAPSKTGAYVALGVGGLGIVLGTVFGLSAKSKHDDLTSQCQSGQCPDSAKGLHDDYKKAGLFSTIGFGVGIVGVGVGTALLLTSPKAPTTATLRLGPGGAMVTGSFR